MRICCVWSIVTVASLHFAGLAWGQGKQEEPELYERARQSLAAGRTDAAEAGLRDLLRHKPRSLEAHFLLGVISSRNGDYEDAQELFLGALRIHPDSVPVLNNLWVNTLHLRREKEAERYFLRVLAIEPQNADALFNLGLVELKRREFAKAADHLDKAAAQRANDLPILQALLAAEMELGKRAAVNEAAQRILRSAPPDPGFYYQLASPLLNRGFDETALRVLERASLLWPDTNAGVHALLGDLYERRGQYERAVEEYQKSVRLDPANEEYHFNLGLEFLTHHNFDLAETVFSNSIRRLPLAPRLRLGLSAAYFARAQYDRAIQTLKEAIEIAPQSEASYFMLGRAYLLLSDHADLFAENWVRDSFQKYLALKTDDALPHFLCALSELRENHRPEALQLLERALELDPKLAEGWFEMGKIHFEEGRYGEAAAAYEKAVGIRPSFVEAYYRLARSYQKLGDQQKAHVAWEAHARRQKELEASVNQRDKQILRFVYTLK